ncbi:MAG: PorV/PorQ family protein, partial [Fibrobacterota bacterium]
MRRLFLLFLLLLPFPAFCVGQAALPTLMLPTHARYSAMGEAGGAACYDPGAVHYNPAGLFFIEPGAGIPVGATYDFEYLLPEFGLEDLTHRNVSLYGRYRELFALAVTSNHISFGKNEWTDSLGRTLGWFNSYDDYIILSLAGKIPMVKGPASYALGLNFKYIYSNLADIIIGNRRIHAVAESFAFDFGFLYREQFLRIFSAGVTLQNMGPNIYYIRPDQADPLPFNLKVSLAAVYEKPGLLKATALFDMNKELVRRRDGDKDIQENGEVRLPDPFWKAFYTAWQDNSWQTEKDEIIRS